MSFSYSGDPSSSDKDAVRFEISDTNASSPLLQDAEIDWCILNETGNTPSTNGVALVTGDIYRSAARCMESLSRLFSAQADTQVGQLKTTYTKMAAQYAAQAQALRLKAQGLNAPYAGGQSISEKLGWSQDVDATQPLFRRREWSNPWTGGGSTYGLDSEDLGPPVG